MRVFPEAANTGLLTEYISEIADAAALDYEDDSYTDVLHGLGVFCRYYVGLPIDGAEVPLDVSPVISSQESTEELVENGTQTDGFETLPIFDDDRDSVVGVLSFYADPNNRQLPLEGPLQDRLSQEVEEAKTAGLLDEAPILHKLILDIMAFGITSGKHAGVRTYQQLKQIYSARLENRLADEPFAVAFGKALRIINLLTTEEAATSPPSVEETIPAPVLEIVPLSPKLTELCPEIGAFEPYGPLGDVLQRLIRERTLNPKQAIRIQAHALRALEGQAAKKDEQQGRYQSECPIREEDIRLIERLYNNDPLRGMRLLPELLRSETPIHTSLMFFAEDKIGRVDLLSNNFAGSDRPGPFMVLAYSISTHMAAELETVMALCT